MTGDALLKKVGAALAEEYSALAIDPRRLKPSELIRLLNSTPLGEVLNARKLSQHRDQAGLRIGDSKIDLLRYAAWLLHNRHATAIPANSPIANGNGDGASQYERHLQQVTIREQAISAKGRDIGSIPPIQDIERRRRCGLSLRTFYETYNPAAFYLPSSSDQLIMDARLEESALQGGLFAFAMPRGGGKTARCRMAALWAVSYAFRKYVFIIGSNAPKAQENLDAIKKFIRFLPDYAADFPEICHALRALKGIAHKSAGQVCQGASTLVEWSKDRVILPTVPPPPNWPADWPLRSDGMVPTSGIVLGTSGLTGEGIRGSVLTLTTGEMIRPDWVLLDDPQTRESANSKTQCNEREQLISADVLGLAGPGKSLSACMPMTVIFPDDLASRMLDRSKHPLWRGERTKMLRSMPKNLDKWEEYFEVYRHCAQLSPANFTRANEHYIANRAVLDEGAEASWEARKEKHEISAIQSAMHIYCRSVSAFMSEFQNDPLPKIAVNADELTADDIAKKVNRLERGIVPIACNHVTAFIDVGHKLLHYVVAAWAEDFTGYVIDYGTFPEQRKAYYAASDARPTLAHETGAKSVEGAIHAGLERLTLQIIGKEWKRDDGANMRIARCAIDANDQSDTVYQYCRQSAFAGTIIPSHGKGITASMKPFSDYIKQPGEQIGHHWWIPNIQGKRTVRHVVIDVNYWKSFVHARLAVEMGAKGCLSLFGKEPSLHRLFADHLKSEYRVPTAGRNRNLDEWKLPPAKPDNHWFDCLVGATMAASMCGAVLSEVSGKTGAKKPSGTLAERQQRTQERHERGETRFAKAKRKLRERETQREDG